MIISHLLFYTFLNFSVEFYKTLYITYVRPIVEVNTLVWSLSQIYSINLVEMEKFFAITNVMQKPGLRHHESNKAVVIT